MACAEGHRPVRRKMDSLSKELDNNYEAEKGLGQPSAEVFQTKFSNIYRI